MTKIIREIDNYKETLDYIKKTEVNVYRKHYKGFEYWILRPEYWENNFIIHDSIITDDSDRSYYKYFHLCGYVVIPKESKYYIDNKAESYNIKCHGGLTYANSREDLDIEFCIGFDCAQESMEDAAIFNLSSLGIEFYKDQTYKTANYVEEECKSIINQLIRNNENT